MKQTKHKYCTSIWHRMPKGVRAGNSPVWQGKKPSKEEIERAEAIEKIERAWIKSESKHDRMAYGGLEDIED